MTARVRRLAVTMMALAASTLLYAAPAEARALCFNCVFDCPSETEEDSVCNALCPGSYEEAECDGDLDCLVFTEKPNELVCDMGPE